ncbi:MAG: decaprenyl-phosphate phosphoribosyltransferase [Planctomycetota bacterium]|nr:decaprenyl-phosphate phosphoribosyltransferase [Planctomycetota bacterium]
MTSPAFVRALRPHQWVKNLFVLAAFGFGLGDQELGLGMAAAWSALAAFFAFSFGASAIYLVNDIMDVEADRAHPTKCRRPIAAGELAVPAAWGLAGVMAIGALILAYVSGSSEFGLKLDGSWKLPLVVGSYMTMNLAYSIKLKHVVLVDVFCIATGFLLRVIGGGVAVGVEVSHWLLLCTLFLALFLGFNKRRAELAALGGEGSTRATLNDYNLPQLDQMVTMIAACTIVCYALYTVDVDTVTKFHAGDRLVWSVPFVVFGLSRYLHLVQNQGAGESPTRVLLGGDKWFLLDLILWAGVIALGLFG